MPLTVLSCVACTTVCLKASDRLALTIFPHPSLTPSTPSPSANRWPLAQARCFFNASLSSSTYFQEKILGLPPPHNKSPRPQFNRPELLITPLLKPINECMSQSKDALKVMQGYIDHLAFNFVKPGKW